MSANKKQTSAHWSNNHSLKYPTVCKNIRQQIHRYRRLITFLFASFLVQRVHFRDVLLLMFDITLRRLNIPANVRVEIASRLVFASEAEYMLTSFL